MRVSLMRLGMAAELQTLGTVLKAGRVDHDEG